MDEDRRSMKEGSYDGSSVCVPGLVHSSVLAQP